MPQHTFIVVTSQKQSQREYELQQSTAKAHAASVCYRKGRESAYKNAILRLENCCTISEVLPQARQGKRITRKGEEVKSSGDVSKLQVPQARQGRRITEREEVKSSKDVSKLEISASDTAWRWINGTSADPFNIIPGSNKGAAPYALEFRKQPS
jgi:hypothetical protein